MAGKSLMYWARNALAWATVRSSTIVENLTSPAPYRKANVAFFMTLRSALVTSSYGFRYATDVMYVWRS